MKIGGKTPNGPNVEYCVLPRGDDPNDSIVLKAQAVLDMTDFDKLCPPPKGKKTLVKGQWVEDVESAVYKAMMEDYGNKRINYMVLKSLEATEGLEWDTVNMSDSNTWENYQKDFKNAGLSDIEIRRVINCVMTANCLNETKLEEAKNSFLLLQQFRQESEQFQKEEQASTLSGEPVSA